MELEMEVGKVLVNATTGAFYNIGGGELWASYDYGTTWEHHEDYTYAVTLPFLRQR